LSILILALFAFEHSEALFFDCTYSTTSYSYAGSVYECDAKVLVFNSADTVERVTQHHASGKSNDDVTSLLMDTRNLPKFPKNIEKFFPNLKVFEIFKSGLTKISSDDLMQFPNLVVLRLSYNKLTTLDGDLFINNPKLQLIYLSYNKITSIGPNILAPLKDLKEAWFSFNTCIDKNAATLSDLQLLITELKAKCSSANDIRLNAI
jgi:Leucine-rich repeat (LRR) protein